MEGQRCIASVPCLQAGRTALIGLRAIDGFSHNMNVTGRPYNEVGVRIERYRALRPNEKPAKNAADDHKDYPTIFAVMMQQSED